MSSVTTRYSHAAPFLRQRLCYAVAAAKDAKTQRDRQAEYAKAYAYADALRILAESDDQTPVDGIADLDQIPARALVFTRKFLGDRSNIRLILGLDVLEPLSHVFVPGDAPTSTCASIPVVVRTSRSTRTPERQLEHPQHTTSRWPRTGVGCRVGVGGDGGVGRTQRKGRTMIDPTTATPAEREQLADLAADLAWLHSAYWHTDDSAHGAERVYELLVDYRTDPDRVVPGLLMNRVAPSDVEELLATLAEVAGTFADGDLSAAADALRGNPVALTPARFVSLATMEHRTGRTLPR